jgi:hypothetical protein
MMVRLYDAKLLRRLKSAVKARTRRSGRKGAKGRWWKVGGGGGKWLWLVWLLANVARIIAGKPGSTETWKIGLLGSMSLAFTGLSLSRAIKMAELLTVGAERRVLWFYPLSESDFFRWTALRFVVRTVWVVVVAAVVYLVASSGTGAEEWTVRIAAPIAEWLLVLCIAIAMVRHIDKLPRWLPLGLYVSAGLMLFAPEPYGKAATPLASALPTGWLYVLMRNPRAKEWMGWLATCTVLALVPLCWRLLKQLETMYCREEVSAIEGNASPAEEALDVVERSAAAQARAEGEKEVSGNTTEAAGVPVLPIQSVWQKQRLENWGSDVGEALKQRQWLKGWNWNAMRPIERVVGWCLNEREKGEAQFWLGPMAPNWSNRWRTAAIATAVGVAAAIAGTWEFNMVSVFAFAVSIGAGLPVLGGVWPATSQGRISGKFSPIFGCYPLSYWTSGWIMFKTNVIRTAAWVPLGLMIAVLNARTARTTITASCWLVGRSVLLFLGLAPILLAGKFSKVTNDTLNMRLKMVPLLGLFLVVISVVATFGAGVFMTSGWWPIVFLGGVVLVSWLSWTAYGWYYDRGQADLLREQV